MSVLGQTVDGDLDLVQGQFTIVTDVARCAAIVLRNKFLFNRGEYFLNVNEGVPWFQYVFVKNPSLLAVKSIFSQVILGTQGIKSIISLTVTRTPDRKASFSFRALADNGAVITGGSGQPFIVEPRQQ